MNSAGATVLTNWKGHVPTAGEWADPENKIPGWIVVRHPHPGDVAAIMDSLGDRVNDTGHVAIVTDPALGLTVSVSSMNGRVVENSWGFRNNQQPTFNFQRSKFNSFD